MRNCNKSGFGPASPEITLRLHSTNLTDTGRIHATCKKVSHILKCHHNPSYTVLALHQGMAAV